MADRTIANPERGCGHLKHGKAYVRGVVGSPDGVLPSFVETRPHVPYKEIGTDGEFTRGFLRFDGLQSQIAAEGKLYDLKPLYPAKATDESAKENHVKAGVYDAADKVPDLQWRRHVDRVGHRAAVFADHWGEAPSTGTSQDVHADLLMRVGQTHYDTPHDFISEAVRLGISKAIPLSQRQQAPNVVPGQTRMWLVHPDACEDGWGVIGHAYLQEVIYTEPVDGNVPQWVQDIEAKGDLDVVELEEPGPSDSYTFDDFKDGEGPDEDDPQQDDGQTEDPVPARPPVRQQTADDFQPDTPDGPDDDENGDDGAADGADSGATVVPDPSDSDMDVQSLRSALEDVSYNDLKSAAADADVEAGQSPSKADLIDALLSEADTNDLTAVANNA
jgi:hypothetical protein